MGGQTGLPQWQYRNQSSDQQMVVRFPDDTGATGCGLDTNDPLPIPVSVQAGEQTGIWNYNRFVVVCNNDG